MFYYTVTPVIVFWFGTGSIARFNESMRDYQATGTIDMPSHAQDFQSESHA